MMIRKAQVAGQFYPAQAAQLKKQIKELIGKEQKKQPALGVIAPHAGYIFSGAVAANCFSQIHLSKTVVVLGPNHTGYGPVFSIMAQGVNWQMPMGDVQVDLELARNILKASRLLQDDVQAHMHEHSIEVQLPLLQYFLPEVKIVPIVLADADFSSYDEIGRAIAQVLTEQRLNCLVLASSDMTHYAPEETAKTNDQLAIEAILKLDGQDLLQRIAKFNITMCGYGPVVTMLSATKALGAKKARLVKYQTSGAASGDYSSVVGYAGILIT